ncbi:uncharacterized protein LOC143033856 isoform X2 [Oratosquilla oratoria]|uniref:uncharacterized protein LOC143033856 isoform X2 n=1 Tax=Oratosquilla oratoria TaxID=337810 RepID=UPI003F75B1CD
MDRTKQSHECCFLFDLKSGCYIIASLSLVASILSLVRLGYLVWAVESSSTFTSDYGLNLTSIRVLYGVLIWAAAIYLLFSTLCIIGAKMEKPGLMLPWIIWTIIFDIAIIVYVSVVRFRSYVGEQVAMLIWLVFTIYFFIIMKLFRQQVMANRVQFMEPLTTWDRVR